MIAAGDDGQVAHRGVGEVHLVRAIRSAGETISDVLAGAAVALAIVVGRE